MTKILQFRKDGRYLRTFDSYYEARKKITGEIKRRQLLAREKTNPFIVPGFKIFLARNLFRESYSANDYIFAFEGDERIIYENGEPKSIDVIEGVGVSSDYNLIHIYKPLVPKFDNAKSSTKVIVAHKVNFPNDKKYFDCVEDARRFTGAHYIWGCLFNENKSSNGWVFYFEDKSRI